MINLLTETIDLLAKNGLKPTDVEWVGSRDGQCEGSWADFAAAADFDYDNGFGVNEIPMGLVVVGSDWWLERHEYDGSEWWELKRRPRHLTDPTPLPPSLRESNIDDWHHPPKAVDP